MRPLPICHKCKSASGFYSAQIDAFICKPCLWDYAGDRVQTEMRVADAYEAYTLLMGHVLAQARPSVN